MQKGSTEKDSDKTKKIIVAIKSEKSKEEKKEIEGVKETREEKVEEKKLAKEIKEEKKEKLERIQAQALKPISETEEPEAPIRQGLERVLSAEPIVVHKPTRKVAEEEKKVEYFERKKTYREFGAEVPETREKPETSYEVMPMTMPGIPIETKTSERKYEATFKPSTKIEERTIPVEKEIRLKEKPSERIYTIKERELMTEEEKEEEERKYKKM